MRRLLAATALVSALVTLNGVAQAQDSRTGESVFHTPAEHDHWEIEVHALLPYYHGFGIGGGARLGIPILPSGFGHRFNNSLNISVGVDFYYDFTIYGYTLLALPIHADAQWNVFLTDRFSVFAEAGFVAEIDIWLCNNGGACTTPSAFYPWFDLAIGGRYHLGPNNGFPALIARIGSAGLTAGISF